VIDATGLCFEYVPGSNVVDNLDARFASGSTTALVGRSGSGKSTLLYLLGLMLTPTAGQLQIAGVNTVGMPDWKRAALRARLMGFVFQDALLDPARSVMDNILEGVQYANIDRRAARDNGLRLLEQFGVDVDPRRRPGQVSGGQAQRVALCRAFVREPQIVLADEPSGNLDDESADVVWNGLHDCADRGAVVIVATHDRVRAEGCDHLLEVTCGGA
jgi:putative ABC transport system ATP-binding protein